MNDEKEKSVSLGGKETPKNVIKSILRFCDYKELHVVRKVSRTFRQANLCPQFRMSYFDAEIFSTKIICEIKFGTKILKIQYRKHRKGCIVENLKQSIASSEKRFDKRNFDQAFAEDQLRCLVFQQSPMELFRLNFHFYKEDEKDEEVQTIASDFTKNVAHALRNRSELIQVQSFSINFTLDTQAAQLLQYFEIEKIQLHKRYLPNYERIMDNTIQQTIQWKKAMELDLGDSVYSGSVKDLLHFKKANVQVQEFTPEFLIHMKNAFLSSPTFESFDLRIIFFDFFHKEQVSDLLGTSYIYEGDIAIWLYGNKEEENILSVRLDYESQLFSFRKEERENINEENIPSGYSIDEIMEINENQFKENVSRMSLFKMKFSATYKDKLIAMDIFVNIHNGRVLMELGTNPSVTLTLTYESREIGCTCGVNGDQLLMEGKDFILIMTDDIQCST